jgi:hypothetical protein
VYKKIEAFEKSHGALELLQREGLERFGVERAAKYLGAFLKQIGPVAKGCGVLTKFLGPLIGIKEILDGKNDRERIERSVDYLTTDGAEMVEDLALKSKIRPVVIGVILGKILVLWMRWYVKIEGAAKIADAEGLVERNRELGWKGYFEVKKLLAEHQARIDSFCDLINASRREGGPSHAKTFASSAYYYQRRDRCKWFTHTREFSGPVR